MCIVVFNSPFFSVALLGLWHFVQVVINYAYLSGIYHFHWRVVYCFSLGIQTHARDVVYMQWFVVNFMNY